MLEISTTSPRGRSRIPGTTRRHSWCAASALICIGPNYSLRINGQLVNTWTENQDRPAAGFVGLQNYPYRQAVRHRNFRIKALL